jgi:hypothetical protein
VRLNEGRCGSILTWNFSGESYLTDSGKFDLSSIPAGSTVNSASFQLCEKNDTDVSLELRKITSSWSESTVTWNNKPTFQSYPYWSKYVGGSANYKCTVWDSTEFSDLRSIVESWINTPAINYGFHLVSQIGLTFVYTSEASTSANRPKLTINYTPPPPPDLIVTDVHPDPLPSAGKFYVGQSVRWYVTVKNNGLGSADSSDVGYYLGTSSSVLGTRIDTDSTSALDSGESNTDSEYYTFTQSDIGTRYIICKADYPDDIDEAYENNNTKYYGPFTVVDPPPANVSGFTAVAGDTQVRLTWGNPGDSDFSGVRIMRKTGSYPVDISDGTMVYNGNGTEWKDSGLENGSKYYYKAFSYDTLGNYADGSVASTTPFDIPIHYVSTNGTHIWPYASWATASTNIQTAVDGKRFFDC